jgi:hypothetical protein
MDLAGAERSSPAPPSVPAARSPSGWPPKRARRLADVDERGGEETVARIAPDRTRFRRSPIPLEALTDAVVALTRDDGAAGRVVELR